MCLPGEYVVRLLGAVVFVESLTFFCVLLGCFLGLFVFLFGAFVGV